VDVSFCDCDLAEPINIDREFLSQFFDMPKRNWLVSELLPVKPFRFVDLPNIDPIFLFGDQGIGGRLVDTVVDPGKGEGIGMDNPKVWLWFVLYLDTQLVDSINSTSCFHVRTLPWEFV
jgi:hypothetical protein